MVENQCQSCPSSFASPESQPCLTTRWFRCVARSENEPKKGLETVSNLPRISKNPVLVLRLLVCYTKHQKPRVPNKLNVWGFGSHNFFQLCFCSQILVFWLPSSGLLKLTFPGTSQVLVPAPGSLVWAKTAWRWEPGLRGDISSNV